MKAIMIVTVMVLSLVANADQFSELWYDGNAEISTYSINEIRYGEPREGVRIMVFVTEPMRLSTHIKPDERLPDSEKIDVIKLNDIRRFTTGIYDYNVMTSVFSAVEKKSGIPLYGTMKVAFTQQDWCGTIFEQTLRKENHYENSIFSYFESEGTQTSALPHGGSAETEDNLWILVRELRGAVLEEGQTKKMKLMRSAWSRRKAHSENSLVHATIHKGEESIIKTAIGTMEAHPFTITFDELEISIWVETAYPRRILSWREPDGSSGKILASHREPYWKQNGNKHEYLRKKVLPDSR